MAIRRQVMWVAALLALASTPGLAQGRGHGRGRQSAPGQVKRESGQRGPAVRGDHQEQRDFDDNDRALAQNWYYHSRADLPPGLRDRDRLPPAYQRRLVRGYVIEPTWRQRLYPVPVALVRHFGPPPPNCRYFVLGGNIVMVDPGYRVLSVISLSFNLGH